MNRIGIIGGGIGGLAVAWNLHAEAKSKNIQTPEIHIFEAEDRFGGNAETKHFDFGNGPGYEDKPLQRWADMGVNDFNTAAYQNIVAVMDQIGYTKENGNYKNLEDSTTYYNTKGHAMTANSTKSGAPDPWWGTAMPSELAKSVSDFMLVAGKDGDKEKFHDYTMEQYIEEQTPVNKWSPDLGPEVIYPRVNGMYFTSGPLGPRSMPFAAVMHYYKIQEGAGGVKADRNYFVGGSSTWIDALVGYMKTHMPEIVFHLNYKAEVVPVAGPTDQYTVNNVTKGATGEGIVCTHICLATPADVALRVMKAAAQPNSGNSGLPQAAANILSQIKYETAVSVAHTDSRLMPVNRNAWSTYNIVIHEPGSVALKPYVINYVANRHQNDAANSEFNKFGLPEFFLSINPHIPVSEDKVLIDTKTGKPATGNLKHFVYDFDCMQAQTDILAQQGKAHLYYASGWTHGSGLHTECWTQGQLVARMILKNFISDGVEESSTSMPTRAQLITSRLSAASAGKMAPC